MELRRWLSDNQDEVSRRWRGEMRVREGRSGEESDGVLGSFLRDLVSFLPPALGEGKEQAQRVWQRAADLYGTLAIQRGASAGEVVEELQLLREVILKLLQDSEMDWGSRSFQRDFMTLNKLLDLGVVRANIAYVDDLFFALLQGSGVPEGLTPEVEDEVRLQLAAFRREMEGTGSVPNGENGIDDWG